jgi:hypothetical protein
MTNLILHVTIPKGLTLTDGRVVHQDYTYDLISRLDPYYCSIDQVRLAGGQIIRKLSDLTIACQIYQASQEVGLISPWPTSSTVINNPVNSITKHRFIGCRNQWVTATATRDLILEQITLLGGPQSHVLANFSVERSKSLLTEGIPARLKELDESIRFYDPTIRSAGVVPPGGKPRFGMAAKGVFDWTEKTPSRTWTSTGLGANVTSWDFGSPTGGRGKPTKFFSDPQYSPPMVNLRFGFHPGTYVLPLLGSSLGFYPPLV